MKQPGTYHRLILCPECKGHKVMMYPNAIDEREELPCKTCKGEGIVNRILTINFEVINQ